MKNYQKSKEKSIKGPNAQGPKYRTPGSFQANRIAGNKTPTVSFKFNPGQFKTQHKG